MNILDNSLPGCYAKTSIPPGDNSDLVTSSIVADTYYILRRGRKEKELSIYMQMCMKGKIETCKQHVYICGLSITIKLWTIFLWSRVVLDYMSNFSLKFSFRVCFQFLS
uniref:Uncharacterized protein n=1 Tax=Cacopsylla melanoneura TaxID=428564 RepID=A0A8D8RJ37_9HEMI